MASTGQRELQPRRLDDLPPAESFTTEFPCPVDRFAALTRLARSRGTLPKAHAKVRRDALAEAKAAGHSGYAVARRAGVHATVAYQLLRTRPA